MWYISSIKNNDDKNSCKNGGAGDQGIVYGYAINNQYNYLPYGVYLSNLIAKEIDTYRKSVDYLLPDGKVQVTISENNLEQLIINVQHKENIHPDFIENEIKQKLCKVPITDVCGTLVVCK